MRFEGSLRQWIVAAVLVAVILPNLVHSSVASSLPGGAQVSCDGNTGIDLDSGACRAWGEALLAGQDLQLPTNVELRHLSNFEIERAFFGMIDRCTVKVSYGSSSSSGFFEQEIPCR